MIDRARKFILGLVVTPDRVRSFVATALSLFLRWASSRKAWEAVSAMPRWLRRVADFIECWNDTEIPSERDRLITYLVRYAVTDEAVDRLIDTVVGIRECRYPDGSKFLTRPELIRMLKSAK